MAWEGSNRRAELPADWPARREACKQRAGGRCEWVRSSGRRCASPGTDADHRTSRDNHDDLQWLCLAPATPVLTPRGWTPLDSIRPGDLVVSPDLESHHVVEVHRREFLGELVVVGEVLATPEHLFLTRDGWTAAALLVPGVEVFSVGVAEHEIDGVVVEAVPVEVMDALCRCDPAVCHERGDEAVFEHQAESRPEEESPVTLLGDVCLALPQRLRRPREAVQVHESTSVGAGVRAGDVAVGDPAHGAAYDARNVYTRPLPASQNGMTRGPARLGAQAAWRPEALAASLTVAKGQEFTRPGAWWHTLGEVRRIAHSGYVHDLSVADSHSYVAATLAVHNCRFHHNMKTQAEAQAAKAAKRAKLRDEPEPHPGRRRRKP